MLSHHSRPTCSWLTELKLSHLDLYSFSHVSQDYPIMSNEDYPGGYVLKLKESQSSKSCRCSGWPSRKLARQLVCSPSEVSVRLWALIFILRLNIKDI